MPTTKVAMMKIIHMTEHVYSKFKCEELFPIFEDYAKRRQTIHEAEIKKKQEEFEKKEKAKEALKQKAYLPTKSFSGNFNSSTSIRNSNGYGLVEDSNIEYNPSTMSNENYRQNKKRPWGGTSKASSSKKGKWGSSNGTGSPNTSGWKKKRNFKTKFKYKKKS